MTLLVALIFDQILIRLGALVMPWTRAQSQAVV
jgi:hypothetical protein